DITFEAAVRAPRPPHAAHAAAADLGLDDIWPDEPPDQRSRSRLDRARSLLAQECGESSVLFRAQDAFQLRRGDRVIPAEGSQIVHPSTFGKLEDSIDMAADALPGFRTDARHDGNLRMASTG